MGNRRRRGRPVDGILVLDKPSAMTSNGALQQVKRLFQAAKAGHTGSLDPLATGVLPLCFGEATKLSQFLLDADKRYVTTMKLGVVTETGDADGEVVSESEVPHFTQEDLEQIVDGFRGLISQVPSMYSAIKVDGQPLYKLARQGIVIERAAREVTIHELTVLDIRDDEIDLDIRCTKGTYVRTLVEDIGQLLGCGAHVTALRRLQSGPFKIEEAISLKELVAIAEEQDVSALDELLQPMGTAVTDWPLVALTELTASYLQQGQPVQVANAPTCGWVQIHAETETEETRFLGVGEVMDDGRIAPRRLVRTY